MPSKFLVNPSRLPKPPEEKTMVFRDLSGGLNLLELDYRMDPDQSPEMKNLWWRDGLLSCRDGQEYLSETELGTGHCCHDRLFRGYGVLHIGDGLYAGRPGRGMELQKLCGGIPEHRGVFLRYRDALLYKTRGAFKSVTQKEDGSLQAEDVKPYVPVTVINCSPEGAGDLYQPENRLSPQKTVWYTAARQTRGVSFAGNGTAKEFRFETQDGEPVATVEQVYVGETLMDKTDYTLAENRQVITFAAAPAKDAAVSVIYTVGVRAYRLPVTEVDSVDEVLVDGAAAEYTADLQTGTVTFASAPPVQDPPVNNTIRITYSRANADAEKSIMDCCCGISYGGTGSAALILAGSEAQPNAYFWNGGHIAMDPGYFPVSNYNLAGDDLEAVTGFGRQAGYLVVFKEHAVGRCLLETETIGDRVYLTLHYTPVNGVLGCDLPGTIRLVENNLVWCNTYSGVCRLEDTTAAMENQVRCISRRINGCRGRPGLLEAVRSAETVCSLDDGERYWVTAGGQTFLWDYRLSGPGDPSWFYFTDIPAVDYFRGDSLSQGEPDSLPYTGARRVFHLDGAGRVTQFTRTFRDYGRGIEKVFQFAAQTFGNYERRKDIRAVRIVTRSDTDTELRICWLTDHGSRWDGTPIVTRNWRLVPRDLRFRFLEIRRFAHVAVRKPGCRHVRHFSLRLENDRPGCDMSVVSAEVTAAFVGKER